MSDHLQGSDAEPWESDGQARHLPECLSANPTLRKAEAPMYGLLCICAELRACEQRLALKWLVTDREAQEREERAYAAGLDAARDAVAALLPADYEANWCAALAAIDALRGDA